jgi:hypothetical protein
MKKIALLSLALLNIFSVMAESKPAAAVVQEKKMTAFEAFGELRKKLSNGELTEQDIQQKVQQGVDLHMIGTWGCSLMDDAIRWGDANMISLLKQHNVKPSQKNLCALFDYDGSVSNPHRIQEYVKQGVNVPAPYLKHIEQKRDDALEACKKDHTTKNNEEREKLKKTCEKLGQWAVLIDVLNYKEDKQAEASEQAPIFSGKKPADEIVWLKIASQASTK